MKVGGPMAWATGSQTPAPQKLGRVPGDLHPYRGRGGLGWQHQGPGCSTGNTLGEECSQTPPARGPSRRVSSAGGHWAASHR